MFNYPLLLIILGISFSEVIGQSSLQYFHKKSGGYEYFIIAIICYAMVCYLLLQSYNHKGMGIINTLWSGMSVIVILCVSIYFFDEKLDTEDIIGIILILVGFTLLTYHNGHKKYEYMI